MTPTKYTELMRSPMLLVPCRGLLTTEGTLYRYNENSSLPIIKKKLAVNSNCRNIYNKIISLKLLSDIVATISSSKYMQAPLEALSELIYVVSLFLCRTVEFKNRFSRVNPPIDEMQRLRVEKMERQLANLTGLVQKALQVPGSTAPVVAPRQEFQTYVSRPATQG